MDDQKRKQRSANLAIPLPLPPTDDQSLGSPGDAVSPLPETSMTDIPLTILIFAIPSLICLSLICALVSFYGLGATDLANAYIAEAYALGSLWLIVALFGLRSQKAKPSLGFERIREEPDEEEIERKKEIEKALAKLPKPETIERRRTKAGSPLVAIWIDGEWEIMG